MSVENGPYVALAGEDTLLLLRMVAEREVGRCKGWFASKMRPEPLRGDRLKETAQGGAGGLVTGYFTDPGSKGKQNA
jgi:hypothetical protein